MVPKSGSFQKEFFCSVAKKSPKNWTGPCLSLNMVRRNRFIKWQTPARNAKSSFEGANPTPPSPMQRRRPPARTTIESKRTVGCLGSEGGKTVIPFFSFFFLHCRTSARHGRSTTGIDCEDKFPRKEKQPSNKTNQQTTPPPGTKPGRKPREICELSETGETYAPLSAPQRFSSTK